MNLRRRHREDDWPTSTESKTILDRARKQTQVENFLHPREDPSYLDGVINMPLLLAAQAAVDQTDQWFANPAAIHALRESYAFDLEWFDEAYNQTIARCLAADQFEER